MKKLMTMLVAVAMVFGLYADPITPVDSFDASDSGATLIDGQWFLDGTEITTDIDEAKIEDSLLKIQTGSKKLTRKFLDDGSSTDIPADGLFFDINLQFLDPIDGSDALTDVAGAKIAAAVIDNSEALKEIAGTQLTPSTNLYVIGGYWDGEAWTKRAYMLDAEGLSGTASKRLTIKMYDSVITGAGVTRSGFRFFKEGVDQALPVLLSFPVLDDGTIDFAHPEEVTKYLGVEPSDVVSAVRSRYSDKTLLVSLVNDSSAVSAVDFVGKANIADFKLTEDPDFIGPDAFTMSVDYDSEDVTITGVSGTVGTPAFADGVITYDAAETELTVTAEYAQGLTIVKWAINGTPVTADAPFAPVRNGTLAITAVAPAAYVITADGTRIPFKNLFGTDKTTDAEAYVKANGGTLQLIGDAVYRGECFLVGVGEAFTLDLASHTFKSTGNQSSIEVFGTLTVTNSTEGTLGAILPPSDKDTNAIHVRGGKAVVSDGRISGKIQTNDGGVELDITGGRIDAIIVQSGEQDRIQTTGGLFNQAVFREANAIPGVDYTTYEAVDNGDGYWRVQLAPEPVAQIGAVKYETFADAFANATDGATITILRDFEGEFFTGNFTTASKFATGLTIDLNGHTWNLTGTAANHERLWEDRKGNSFLFKNGSLKAVPDSTTKQTIAFYTYAETLEFNDVALDFSALKVEASADPDDPRRSVPIVSQNGNVKFTGTTTVKLAANQRLVTMLDRAGADYEPGTLTLDAGGTLPGDVLLYSACKIAVGAGTTLSGKVFTGAAAYSGFEPAGAAGSPFVAMVGAILPATGSSSVNTRGGQLYTTIEDAQAAIAMTTFAKNVIVLQDATKDSFEVVSGTVNFEIPADVTFTATTSFTLNGAKVKLDEDGTLVVPAALDIATDFVAPAEDKEIKVTGDGPYTYTVGDAVVPPINPGHSSDPYETREEAEAAAEKAPILPADNFELTGEALATWQGYFVNLVYVDGNGKYRFAPVMNAAGSNAVAQAEATLTKAIDVAGIAAATEAIATMELSGAEPGFYYTLFRSDDVTTVLDIESHDKNNSDKMAKADGKVTFVNVTKPGVAAGFFSVKAFDHESFTTPTPAE